VDEWADGSVQVGDIVVSSPSGFCVALGDVITVPTIVVLARYYG